MYITVVEHRTRKHENSWLKLMPFPCQLWHYLIRLSLEITQKQEYFMRTCNHICYQYPSIMRVTLLRRCVQ